jgi:hypothetical protein
MAYGSLGLDYSQRGLRDKAASHYRSSLAALETSGRSLSSLSAYAREAVTMSRNNLRVLEAETPAAKQDAELRGASEVLQTDPEHAALRLSATVYARELQPVERPACAGCGATPIRLLRCSGSCGGEKEQFCSAACFSRSWADHRRRLGCRNVS